MNTSASYSVTVVRHSILALAYDNLIRDSKYLLVMGIEESDEFYLKFK